MITVRQSATKPIATTLGVLLLLFAGWLVSADSAEGQGAQPPPPSECPAQLPSFAKVDETFTLRTVPDNPDAVVTWEITGATVTALDETGHEVMVNFTRGNASGGRERPVTLTIDDGDNPATIECGGIVAVERNAIVVGTGESLKAAVNNTEDAKRIYLDRGIHQHVDDIKVRPRNGQFISGFVSTDGTLLSVLDGANSEDSDLQVRPAFEAVANHNGNYPTVTIKNLELTNWKTHKDAGLGHFGVIHARSTTSAKRTGCTATRLDGDGIEVSGYGAPVPWTLTNLDVHNNDGVGVIMATGMTLEDSRINNNSHLGIGGSYINGAVIDNVEASGNATGLTLAKWKSHAGGIKLTRATQVKIINSTFADNGGPGIWLDIGSSHNRVVNNTTTGNTTHGIFQEISWASDISNNTSTGNSTHEPGAFHDIFIAESGGYRTGDGRAVMNLVEANKIGEGRVFTRPDDNTEPLDRECEFLAFKDVDADLLPNPGTIDDYELHFNAFRNNGGPNGGQGQGVSADHELADGWDGASEDYEEHYAWLPVKPAACEASVSNGQITVTVQPVAPDYAARYLLYQLTSSTWLASVDASVTTITYPLEDFVLDPLPELGVKTKSGREFYSAATTCTWN